MSRKHPSTGTLQQGPTAAEAAALRARRARTLLALEASRAAIEAYRDIVVQQCDAAVALLAELEPFTEGAELPPRAIRFADALRQRMSADEKTRESAFEGYRELLDDIENVPIASTCVTETFAQAVGVCETPIEISLRKIRDQITEVDCMRTVETAFRAPLGGSRSHAEILGTSRIEESDSLVVVSREQEEWFSCAQEARKLLREHAAQKQVVARA